jgi:hypothetical protein
VRSPGDDVVKPFGDDGARRDEVVLSVENEALPGKLVGVGLAFIEAGETTERPDEKEENKCDVKNLRAGDYLAAKLVYFLNTPISRSDAHGALLSTQRILPANKYLIPSCGYTSVIQQFDKCR